MSRLATFVRLLDSLEVSPDTPLLDGLLARNQHG